MIKTISVKKALSISKATIIDTRSPKEYEEDHIPGAINKPLFSNEERKLVGTLYKQNQNKGYQKGIDIYTKKIIKFIEEFKKINEEQPIIIYCARGGMRSRTIAELINAIKKDSYQLEGGYKAYRKYIREYFENYKEEFELLVLQGLAGTGKTDLIKKLEPSIDLEGMAKHRSSLFGAIGLKPTSQKRFESKLWNKIEELKNKKIKKTFIEGEAKKIGNVNIPQKFFETITKSQTIKIISNIEKRSERIVRDYFTHGEDEKIKNIIISLKVAIGNKKVEELNKLIDEKNYLPVAKFLLEKYYDPKYKHAIEKIKYLKEINNDNTEEAIKKLNKIIKE